MPRQNNPLETGLYQLWLVPDEKGALDYDLTAEDFFSQPIKGRTEKKLDELLAADRKGNIQLLGAYDDLAQAMLAKAAGEAGITDDSYIVVTKRVEVHTHYEDASISVAGVAQNRGQ